MTTETNRLADIQTSLAVLASSANTQQEAVLRVEKAMEKNLVHEDRLFTKIFDKVDDLEDRVSKAEGAMTGARWVLGVVTALASVTAFLGLKG
jgi:hypothetical protein|tara:strand:- start:1431 stop:1709 length:279 start_codon:yes stop_codon:yes gene_type:complete